MTRFRNKPRRGPTWTTTDPVHGLLSFPDNRPDVSPWEDFTSPGDTSDGRLFSPSTGAYVLDYPPPRQRGGAVARIRVAKRLSRPSGYPPTFSPSYRLLGPPAGLAFKRPTEVVLCQRRAARRAVLFAAGRGGTKVRRPHYSQYSQISCRR